jgi:hypothetical protein
MSLVLNGKTYNFDGYDQNGVSVYTERSGGTPTAFSVLTFGMSSATNVQRVTARLSVPIVAADDSDCSCAGTVLRTSRFTWTFDLPNTGTTAERTDFEARIESLTATAAFEALLVNLVKPSV